MEYDPFKTMHENWVHELNHIDELSIEFMRENHSRTKPGNHYKDIQEAFLIGYRRGKENRVIDEADFIHKQWAELRKERGRLEGYARRLEIKESKLYTFHAHVRRKLKEIKKLKSILKETFAIKQVE